MSTRVSVRPPSLLRVYNTHVSNAQYEAHARYQLVNIRCLGTPVSHLAVVHMLPQALNVDVDW